MKKTYKSKGITLIALIITIIVLLVLAGISIQLLTNKDILEKSKQAELENKRAQISEWLNLKLIEEQANKALKPSAASIIEETRNNVIEHQNELEKIGGDVNVEDIRNEENGQKTDDYFYVIVDDDVYKVDENGVEFIGKVTDLTPIIKLENIDNTTSTITVEVSTKYNIDGNIEYYLKGENDTEYKLIETTSEESYTYTKLEDDKNYSIKVVAITPNGKKAEVLASKTTGSVAELTSGNTTFIYSVDGQTIDKNTWTNKKVKVTAKSDLAKDGCTIQTSKDGETWENIDNQIFEGNGTIYARLWDGTNYGKGSASGNVTNIDTVKPTGTISAESNSKSITVKVTANDVAATSTNGYSGIKGYYYSINNGASYTGITSSTSYTFNGLTQGTTYYIKVKVEDNAGNILELSTKKATVVITLALSSTSGTVVDGASKTATISGSNYGTLSVTSSNTSVATANINGNTLTVTGTITSGTNTATITLTGSEGGSATYTVTAHKHTGNSSSGGGCYTNASTSSYTYTCSGCQTSSYSYTCSGCTQNCLAHSACVWRCSQSSGKDSIIESCIMGCPSCTTTCPGHTGTSTYCPGHTGYTTTYSKACGF